MTNTAATSSTVAGSSDPSTTKLTFTPKSQKTSGTSLKSKDQGIQEKSMLKNNHAKHPNNNLVTNTRNDTNNSKTTPVTTNRSNHSTSTKSMTKTPAPFNNHYGHLYTAVVSAEKDHKSNDDASISDPMDIDRPTSRSPSNLNVVNKSPPPLNTIEKLSPQEIRELRVKHGKKLTETSDAKERKFHITIHFRNKDKGTNPVENVLRIHREFCQEFFDITLGDVQFSPTRIIKVTDDDDDDKDESVPPAPMISAAGFPSSEKEHKKFFHRKVENTHTRTSVKIFHSVVMREPVHNVKTKLFKFLKQNDIWMAGGELDGVELCIVGWFLGAHTNITYRPQLTIEMNQIIRAIPNLHDLIEEYSSNTSSGSDKTIPSVHMWIRHRDWGGGADRVSTSYIAIQCLRSRANLVKELLDNVPEANMPFKYVPVGYVQAIDSESFRQLLMYNNDLVNQITSIPVEGFSEELLEMNISTERPNEPDQTTVKQFLMAQEGMIRIEHTDSTAKWGRFLFAVNRSHHDTLYHLIADFCNRIFFDLLNNEEERDEYRRKYNKLPRMGKLPPPGGAFLAKCKGIEALVKDHSTQRALHKPSWLQVASTQVVFDDKQFSTINTSAAPHDQDTLTAGSTETASTNNSANTNSSKTKVSSSGQTLESHDFSTITNDLRSIISDQHSANQKLFQDMHREADVRAEKNQALAEERFERQLRIAEERADKLQAIAERRAMEERERADERMAKVLEHNQQFMSMMITTVLSQMQQNAASGNHGYNYQLGMPQQPAPLAYAHDGLAPHRKYEMQRQGHLPSTPSPVTAEGHTQYQSHPTTVSTNLTLPPGHRHQPPNSDPYGMQSSDLAKPYMAKPAPMMTAVLQPASSNATSTTLPTTQPFNSQVIETVDTPMLDMAEDVQIKKTTQSKVMAPTVDQYTMAHDSNLSPDRSIPASEWSTPLSSLPKKSKKSCTQKRTNHHKLRATRLDKSNTRFDALDTFSSSSGSSSEDETTDSHISTFSKTIIGFDHSSPVQSPSCLNINKQVDSSKRARSPGSTPIKDKHVCVDSDDESTDTARTSNSAQKCLDFEQKSLSVPPDIGTRANQQ